MELQVIEGVVVFLAANEGSKSEGRLPCLYRGKSEALLPLFKQDDNPFENNGLLPYDGHRVKVTGSVGRNGCFVVNDVQTI